MQTLWSISHLGSAHSCLDFRAVWDRPDQVHPSCQIHASLGMIPCRSRQSHLVSYGNRWIVNLTDPHRQVGCLEDWSSLPSKEQLDKNPTAALALSSSDALRNSKVAQEFYQSR